MATATKFPATEQTEPMPNSIRCSDVVAVTADNFVRGESDR